MKELDAINERLDSNDEIIDSLVKKNTNMEKQMAEMKIPDYSASMENIISELKDIKQYDNANQHLALLNAIKDRLDKIPKSATRQLRIVLFPETNQGQYYKIVFGRLIPWGLAFVVSTYIFITGYKAIEIYRYNESISQSVHYQRAWLYLQQHAKKKMLSAMDEAYDKTTEK